MVNKLNRCGDSLAIHAPLLLTTLLLAPLASLPAADVAQERGRPLIPTIGKPPEYKPDTTWLDEVAGALASWKYPPRSTNR